MEKKQSSIDWLEDKLNGVDTGVSHHYFNSIIQEAKAMHKAEIEEAFTRGLITEDVYYGYDDKKEEKYYNETFGNE